MTHATHRFTLLALAGWVLTPIVVLALRAVSLSWRYPQIMPMATASGGAFEALADPRLVAAAATSFWLALATGVLGTVLGFVTARLVTRASGRLQQLTWLGALFLVVAPPLASGVGLQVVMLSLGFGGTVLGVLLAHLVPATGYLTLFAAGILGSMQSGIEDEARTLGASRLQVWTRVLLPQLAPRFAESVVLGALISWGQLALTLLVGGGVVRTLPVELLSLVRSGNDQAGALAALVLSLPPLLGLGLLVRATRRTGAAL
ncbi:MAG: ABC transporter permease subunit [Acidobacteria bacterium]|nr:ABC transporter permease subunit [Acidobacteriota bacterium]